MTVVNEIHEDKLLEAILQALEQDDGGDEPGTITTAEAQAKTGKGYRSTGRLLKQMSADGVIRPDLILRVDAWGYKAKRKGYRLVKAQSE